jgi:hypothetical protein
VSATDSSAAADASVGGIQQSYPNAASTMEMSYCGNSLEPLGSALREVEPAVRIDAPDS